MKPRLIWNLAALALFASFGSASARDLVVYKANTTFKGFLQRQENGKSTLVKYRMNSKELINLAIGRPLNSAVQDYELVAVAVDYQAALAGDTAAEKRLIVVDTSNNTYGSVAISQATSVCNAETEKTTFKRYGFGGGDVQQLGTANFGLTGGRLQMTGTLTKKTAESGPTPVLKQSLVGQLDMRLDGVAETYHITSGVLTASGAPIGTITVP